ncbi:D-alanyl-D-alanine carboxypeptidase [Aerococcaceae bacterium DSM 111176]|nr:D-alanyl-D-alanine carboxypeptidase [Aerococcaceae bacterium DSM 111176]
MQQRKRLIVLLTALVLQLFLPLQSLFAQTNNQEEDEAVYLVTESQNGIILDESRSNEVQDVGTLSKVLSIYLIYQAIDNGDINLDDSVPLSDEAFELSQDYDIDNIPLRPDGEYTVEELLPPMVTSQANGVILSLAELVAGSEQAFVERMNQQLIDWGIEDAEIYNVTGLPVDFTPNSGDSTTTGLVNRMSAAALATCSYYLMNQFPEILELTAVDRATFRDGTDDEFDYHNRLMQLGYFYDLNIGGLFMRQVGEDDDAQLSAIVTHEQNNVQTITVLLDFPADEFEPFGTNLLQENGRQYTHEVIAETDDPVSQINAVYINQYGQDEAPLSYATDFHVIVPRGDIAPQLLYKLKPNYRYFTTNNQLMTPVKEGTNVGTVEVSTMDQTTNTGRVMPSLPSTPGNAATIKVSQDVDEGQTLQWLQDTQEAISTTWRDIRMFFVDLFN